MTPKIYAVVVAYNRGKKIQETLNSLLEQSVPIRKIIVVDNSTDSEKKVHLINKSRKIKVISTGKNFGPGWARNIGMSQSLDADFVIFLDDDIIFEGGTVSYLLDAFRKNEDCVGAMPVIYFKERKDRVWSSGSGINLVTGQTYFNVKSPDKEFLEVPAATSVIMVKPDAVRKSGWYDPIYFFSYEDTDFYFRLRIRNHGKIYVSSSAKAYHDIPVRDTKAYYRLALRSYYIGRGRVIFLKHFGSNFTLNLFFVLLFSLYYFYLGLKLGLPLSGIRFLEGAVDGLKVVLKGDGKLSEKVRVKSKIVIGRINKPIFLKNYIVTTW